MENWLLFGSFCAGDLIPGLSGPKIGLVLPANLTAFETKLKANQKQAFGKIAVVTARWRGGDWKDAN